MQKVLGSSLSHCDFSLINIELSVWKISANTEIPISVAIIREDVKIIYYISK